MPWCGSFSFITLDTLVGPFNLKTEVLGQSLMLFHFNNPFSPLKKFFFFSLSNTISLILDPSCGLYLFSHFLSLSEVFPHLHLTALVITSEFEIFLRALLFYNSCCISCYCINAVSLKVFFYQLFPLTTQSALSHILNILKTRFFILNSPLSKVQNVSKILSSMRHYQICVFDVQSRSSRENELEQIRDRVCNLAEK